MAAKVQIPILSKVTRVANHPNVGLRILFALGIGLLSHALIQPVTFAFSSENPMDLALKQSISTLALFFLPALCFYYWQSRWTEWVSHGTQLNWILALILSGLALVGWTPLGELVSESISSYSSVPDWWLDLRDNQNQIAEYFTQLVKADGYGALWTFVSLTLIPAISEEAFFRGVLQHNLRFSLSPFWSILITSVLFSLAHMQVDYVFTILWMSIVLGLIYHITQSVVMSAFAHFAFNATSFFVQRYELTNGIEETGVILLSTSAAAVALWVLYIKKRRSKEL